MLPLVLTRTVDPIPSVAKVTVASETSLCVSAVCILIAVVIITVTFIDICVWRLPHNTVAPYHLSARFIKLDLTSAVQPIPIQLVTSVTAAVEAANGVIADLFTSSIAGSTLINI